MTESVKGHPVKVEVCQYYVCRPRLADQVHGQPSRTGLVDVDGASIQSGPKPPMFTWSEVEGGISLLDASEAWADRQPVTNPPTGGAVESARQILALLECPGSREMLMMVASAIDRATMIPELLDASEAVVTQLDVEDARSELGLGVSTAQDARVGESVAALRSVVSLLRCRRQAGGLPPPRKEKDPAETVVAD